MSGHNAYECIFYNSGEHYLSFKAPHSMNTQDVVSTNVQVAVILEGTHMYQLISVVCEVALNFSWKAIKRRITSNILDRPADSVTVLLIFIYAVPAPQLDCSFLSFQLASMIRSKVGKCVVPQAFLVNSIQNLTYTLIKRSKYIMTTTHPVVPDILDLSQKANAVRLVILFIMRIFYHFCKELQECITLGASALLV